MGFDSFESFDALHSLETTISSLQNSSRISFVTPSREYLESANDGAGLASELLGVLEMFRNSIESKVMKACEGKIREAVRELEDAIDLHVLDQFLSQSENRPLLFSLDLQELRQDIDCFTQMVQKIQRLFGYMFDFEIGEEEKEEVEKDDDKYGVFRDRIISFAATKAASVFLGVEEEYIKELESLFPVAGSKSKGRCHEITNRIESWWANKVASMVMEEEECIKELDSPSPQEEEVEEEEEEDDDVSSRNEFARNPSNIVGLTDLFCEIRNKLSSISLRDRIACIVGMAGIGKTAIAKKIFEDPLIVSKFRYRSFVRMLPESKKEEIMQVILAQVNPDGDKMLVEGDEKLGGYLHKTLTGRKYLIVLDDVWNLDVWNFLVKILPFENKGSWILVTTRLEHLARYIEVYCIYKVRFLNKEESWDLLRGKVFGEEVCPPQLEKAGKKIAENCEGLPLLILTVADLLRKVEKNLEYWSEVAKDKENSVFMDAYDQILEVLYPSYEDLPVHLKPYFLYIGAFPQNYEVRLSRLINLLRVEGLLVDEDGFDYLVSSNVVLVCQRSSIHGKLKACSLHSVFWHLCRIEARNDKFLHALNSYADARTDGIERQRRLSIYKNIIFSIKDVRNSIASISTVRSLLCTGPYHQYQVPISFGLRLLKVLDTLTIRFYEFPIEVLKLLQLRYLALTCNGNLSPSISNLWNLKYLIIHQHLGIISTVSQSYLPVEIWMLRELEYLQIMGRNLPDPPYGAVLKNLCTLLDVGAHTCTKRVLKSIPNLVKLRVQIELTPDAAEPLIFFDDISYLKELTSLRCIVMNPKLMSGIVSPTHSVFTLSIRKLTLSGCGYPWKYMNEIAELFNLQVLKLKCYAFRGEKWEAGRKKFRELKYLSIEDTDLVKWTIGDQTFPKLLSLTMKNCYKLQEIPKILSVREIRLVDCNPSAVTCAQQMRPGNSSTYVDSSWDDESCFKS